MSSKGRNDDKMLGDGLLFAGVLVVVALLLLMVLVVILRVVTGS